MLLVAHNTSTFTDSEVLATSVILNRLMILQIMVQKYCLTTYKCWVIVEPKIFYLNNTSLRHYCFGTNFVITKAVRQ